MLTAANFFSRGGKRADGSRLAEKIEAWLDDEDGKVRFLTAVCVLQNKGRQGVDRAADALADAVGFHSADSGALKYLLESEECLEMVTGMLFYPSSRVATAACKVFLHLSKGGVRDTFVDALLKDEAAFRKAVEDAYSPAYSVRKSSDNVHPDAREEVLDVLSIVLQNAAARRPGKVRGVRGVVEAHLRQGGGEGLRKANLRAMLDFTKGG